MYLIQILLPVYDNHGVQFPKSSYDELQSVLLQRFGGLTSYARAPARGLWEPDEGPAVVDDIVIMEIMDQQIDSVWWKNCRRTLEQRFRQQSIVIRAQLITLL